MAEFFKKLYANKTVYRLVWTTIQVGTGLIAGYFADNAGVGVLVTALAVIITSEARDRLSKSE